MKIEKKRERERKILIYIVLRLRLRYEIEIENQINKIITVLEIISFYCINKINKNDLNKTQKKLI